MTMVKKKATRKSRTAIVEPVPEVNVCYVCHEPAKPNNPLISYRYCECRGPISMLHRTCHTKVLKTAMSKLPPYRCTVCRSIYLTKSKATASYVLKKLWEWWFDTRQWTTPCLWLLTVVFIWLGDGMFSNSTREMFEVSITSMEHIFQHASILFIWATMPDSSRAISDGTNIQVYAIALLEIFVTISKLGFIRENITIGVFKLVCLRLWMLTRTILNCLIVLSFCEMIAIHYRKIRYVINDAPVTFIERQ
jgi:hypothetical protein